MQLWWSDDNCNNSSSMNQIRNKSRRSRLVLCFLELVILHELHDDLPDQMAPSLNNFMSSSPYLVLSHHVTVAQPGHDKYCNRQTYLPPLRITVYCQQLKDHFLPSKPELRKWGNITIATPRVVLPKPFPSKVCAYLGSNLIVGIVKSINNALQSCSQNYSLQDLSKVVTFESHGDQRLSYDQRLFKPQYERNSIWTVHIYTNSESRTSSKSRYEASISLRTSRRFVECWILVLGRYRLALRPHPASKG